MLYWHYTSFTVLTSIFSGDKPTLRATHIDHLNDLSELRHGLIAIKQMHEATGPLKYKTTIELLGKMLAFEYDHSLYSFSLSAAENSLYQWLAYCPSKGGIALGFEIDREKNGDSIQTQTSFELPLPKSEPSQIQNPRFGKCNYFLEWKEIQEDWFTFWDDENDPKGYKTLEVQLLTNAIFFKNKAFDFEKEYRLMFDPTPRNPWNIPIKFHGTKPYIDFHFPKNILKVIYVSPRGDALSTYKAVETFLSENNLSHVQITVSTIPFRE